MASFTGTTSHSCDSSGRIAIPSRFRKMISDNTMYVTNGLTNGLGSCLWAYPGDEWQKVLDSFSNLPTNNPKIKKMRMIIVGEAYSMELDKQGRIMLNSSLCEKLRIEELNDRKIVIVGDINKLQIWNPTEYKRYVDSITEDSIDEILNEFDFEF